MPYDFVILLCLTLDNFTCQGESASVTANQCITLFSLMPDNFTHQEERALPLKGLNLDPNHYLISTFNQSFFGFNFITKFLNRFISFSHQQFSLLQLGDQCCVLLYLCSEFPHYFLLVDAFLFPGLLASLFRILQFLQQVLKVLVFLCKQ